MLGNCEKTVIVSPTIHKWPQNQVNEKGLNLMASSTTGNRVMEKPSQQQDPNHHQLALKCPRCDSSNTKFCYYNNYSLSQPRHFCKACKRYWTRGGTLRNVPVGGGCRKNKRTKRSPSSAIDAPSSSSSPPTPATVASSNASAQPQIDLSSSSTTHITPLFYGLPTNPSELTLPYPRFNSRVSNVDAVSGFDLQPQLNALGLGFSSGLMNNGFHHPNKQIQASAAAVTSNSLLSSYSLFGSSTSSSSSSLASPTMASLLASTIQQQKFISNGLKDIREASSFHHQGLMLPYQELQMPGNGESGNMGSKEVKMEEGPNRLDWNHPFQNQMDQTNASDPSVYWNGTSVGGAWLDPANIGSSVPSLI